MSSNTKATRSKGESDGLSLPARTRQRRKPKNMENDDEDTVLNTTFDAGSGQHHPQMPVHTSPLSNNVIITVVAEQTWETYEHTKHRVIDTVVASLGKTGNPSEIEEAKCIDIILYQIGKTKT